MPCPLISLVYAELIFRNITQYVDDLEHKLNFQIHKSVEVAQIGKDEALKLIIGKWVDLSKSGDSEIWNFVESSLPVKAALPIIPALPDKTVISSSEEVASPNTADSHSHLIHILFLPDL